MRPLSSIFPAALMRLFQEELLVWINAVVHEGRELVFYFLELVVGDRLRDGCERPSPAAGRVRQPSGGAQQVSHASYAAFYGCWWPPQYSFLLCSWSQVRHWIFMRAQKSRDAARSCFTSS